MKQICGQLIDSSNGSLAEMELVCVLLLNKCLSKLITCYIGNYAKYKDKKQSPEENRQKGIIIVSVLLMLIKFLLNIANKRMSMT